MALMLVGCATPYQPVGFMGGYDDYRAGAGGAVMVTFEGNGYTSESAVVRMWHRRAAEICGGSDRYVVLDSEKSYTVSESASTSTTNMTFNGNHATATTTTQPGMQWTRHKLQGLIRCVTDPPPPPPTSKATVIVKPAEPTPVPTSAPPPAGTSNDLGF